jgi:phage-related protein
MNELLKQVERVRSWLNKENKEVLTRKDCENILYLAILKAESLTEGAEGADFDKQREKI